MVKTWARRGKTQGNPPVCETTLHIQYNEQLGHAASIVNLYHRALVCVGQWYAWNPSIKIHSMPLTSLEVCVVYTARAEGMLSGVCVHAWPCTVRCRASVFEYLCKLTRMCSYVVLSLVCRVVRYSCV